MLFRKRHKENRCPSQDFPTCHNGYKLFRSSGNHNVSLFSTLLTNKFTMHIKSIWFLKFQVNIFTFCYDLANVVLVVCASLSGTVDYRLFHDITNGFSSFGKSVSFLQFKSQASPQWHSFLPLGKLRHSFECFGSQ